MGGLDRLCDPQTRGRRGCSPVDRSAADCGFRGGIHVDNVELVRHEPFDYEVKASGHLLIASERAERYDGETLVDGLPRSHLRTWSGKMTFVPAGCRFYGWQKPRALTRSTFLLIDPQGSLHPELRFAETEFRPRLFFSIEICGRRAQAEGAGGSSMSSPESLCRSAQHRVGARAHTHERRCLAAVVRHPRRAPNWQQRKLAQYIEEHLAEDISLLALARLVQLSPYHFSRAFKQSFGMPPHRYLTSGQSNVPRACWWSVRLSVTEIGFEVGFSESSSFSAAFRKLTGETPTIPPQLGIERAAER